MHNRESFNFDTNMLNFTNLILSQFCANAITNIRWELKLDPERPEYHRAVGSYGSYASNATTTAAAATASTAGLIAHSTGPQASCRLLSMKGANALLCLPAEIGTVKQYSTVTALLIGDIQPPTDSALYYFSKAAAV
jgi:MoeA C-terminal region (domain IV)